MKKTINLFASAATALACATPAGASLPPAGGDANLVALFMKYQAAMISGTMATGKHDVADCSRLYIKYEGASGSRTTRAFGSAATGSCRFNLRTPELKTNSREQGMLYYKYSDTGEWSRAQSITVRPGLTSTPLLKYLHKGGKKSESDIQ